MDLYEQTAAETAKLLTNRYSTSFSMACRLFAPSIRPDIYNIYGLVRLADEVVDTYQGPNQAKILDELEAAVQQARDCKYSSNLLVEAYMLTDQKYDLGDELLRPFFASMRADIGTSNHDDASLEQYIFGSAEVVGLMCLKVFTGGDQVLYEKLKPGAQALGAAFQKVNFLRDLAADHDGLGRIYLPGVTWETFNDTTKRDFETSIAADFAVAQTAIRQLPNSSRPAVQTAYKYYLRLFQKLQKTSADDLKQTRVRLPNSYKLWLLVQTYITAKFSQLGRS